MSAKRRVTVVGAPVVRQLPAPAGGVKLETFLPWRLVKRRLRREVITPFGAPQSLPTPEATPEAQALAAAKDTALTRALGLAYHWQRLLQERRVASVTDIAKAEGMDVSQVHRLMRLTLLAPEVVERLVAAPDLPVERLLGRPWPYGWAEQARVLAGSM